MVRSSAKAEYKVMASTTAELTWLYTLFQDLQIPLTKASSLYCDNMSALYMIANPILHARTKHIELDYLYV